jgi:hypothetical protein
VYRGAFGEEIEREPYARNSIRDYAVEGIAEEFGRARPSEHLHPVTNRVSPDYYIFPTNYSLFSGKIYR